MQAVEDRSRVGFAYVPGGEILNVMNDRKIKIGNDKKNKRHIDQLRPKFTAHKNQ
jgi:hypothetical protein